MSGEHAPWVKEGPEDAPPENRVSRREDETVMLGLVPDEFDIGTVVAGTEHVVEIARPTLLNGRGALVTSLARPRRNSSKPSAFRDQFGLDPSPVLDQDEADAFELACPPTVPLSAYDAKPASIRLRFKPARAGAMSTAVTVKAIGSDGSLDSKDIRVSGYAKPAPRIVNTPRLPDPANGFVPVTATRPLARNAHGVDTARAQADDVAARQEIGITVAENEVKSYRKAPPPRSEWSWIIDMAISMGVASIAGVIARLAASKIAEGVSRPREVPAPTPDRPVPGDTLVDDVGTVTEAAKPNEVLTQMLSEGLKEGIKNSVKKGFPLPNKRTHEEGSDESREISEDPTIRFFAEHRLRLSDVKLHLREFVNTLHHQLRSVDPEQADAALFVVAEVLHQAAPSALYLQTRATEFQWISATAKTGLGTQQAKLPDGTVYETTNMDQALDAGESGLYAIGSGTMPTHDGVLDLHVNLLAKGPADSTEFAVEKASLTGVSHLVANRLRTTDLAAAGVPIRLVVSGSGQAALITRDEVGNVRVSGLLRTEDGTARTEAHMHKGATLLTNRVLAKTLAQWGVRTIHTDDATARAVAR